jgi:hypothetical protein
MDAMEIVRPALVLAGWTLVMFGWMGLTRIPAMSAAKIDPQQARDTVRLRELLPEEVQRVANNYNHLFEQPTLFYAVVLMLVATNLVDDLHVACAWTFTGLRIVHSCVQATIDVVPIRFGLFVLSWVALGTMIVRALIAAF